jgi:3-phenylpropionate/trans-cinnamate dioxygenase ferredoxin component
MAVPFHDAYPAAMLEPGSSTVVDVDGYPVSLANVDGEYFAFQALCPHQGTKLGGRPVRGCVITCAQHSSAFDVRTGECLQPAEGDGFAQDLMIFAVEVVEGIIRVSV